MEVQELHWLAGLLEGEGSFCKGPPSAPNRPVVSLHMTDLDIVERVSKIFGRKLWKCKRQKEHHKESYRVAITGKRAVELMKVLEPLMGARRKEQIRNAVLSYDDTAFQKKWENRKKLSSENIEWAKANPDLSIRKRARILGVDHETMRQFLIKGYRYK